jgi:hypothetical protein
MKQKALLVLALASMLCGQSYAAVLLNEILINPPGTDGTNEYVEIISTNPSDSLTNVWLLEIEGEAAKKRGTVDNARNLTGLSFGTNGLLVLGEGYSTSNPWGITDPPTGLTNLNRPASDGVTMENGGVTMMLVLTNDNVTIPIGTDYDSDNDGQWDATIPWISVLDSIGWKEGIIGAVYGPELVRVTGAPDAASRIFGDTSANNATAWWGGAVVETPGQPSPDFSVIYDDSDAVNWANRTCNNITPGAINVPEPSTLFMLAIGALLILGLRRKAS